MFLGIIDRLISAYETCRSEHDKATEARAELERLLEHTDEQYRTKAQAAVAELAAEARGQAGITTERSSRERDAQEEVRRLTEEEPEARWATLTGSALTAPVRAEDAQRKSGELTETAVTAMQMVQAQLTVLTEVTEEMRAFATRVTLGER